MLYTVNILLSVQPHSSRRYSSALLTKCQQTLGIITVPSHSCESSIQLLISSIISTIQIFQVEIILRIFVLMMASFSKIFMFLKSIAFCFLQLVYSSRFQKQRFSPLSVMSLSSHIITLSQVQNQEMLISSWLNMLFQSYSNLSKNWVLLAEIYYMKEGQRFQILGGVLFLFIQQRQSKNEMFLKVLFIELLNYARIPSSIVLSNLQRRESASGFSCSQRKKMNCDANNSCAWKIMLSLRIGKS